jgi:hypothetical protein
VPPVGGPADAAGHDSRQLGQAWEELLEYVSHYVHSLVDLLRLKGRKVLLRLQLEILAILIAAGAIFAAIVLVAIGSAQGFTVAFGNRPWLGNLTAGLVLLGCVTVGILTRAHLSKKASRERIMKKYELRKQQQRAKFGRDVTEAADHPDQRN